MTTILEARAPANPSSAPEKFGEGFLWDCWYLVAPSSALKRGSVSAFTILGDPIAVGRSDSGDVYALRDRCPHRSVPLSAGRMRKEGETGVETLECPYHGWRFRTDGVCAAIPASAEEPGQGPDLTAIRVRTYPLMEQQNLVWIWMSRDPAARPVDKPVLLPGIGSRRPSLIDRLDYPIHVDHAILGLIDPAHGPYVHRQWWWRAGGSEHLKIKAFEPCEQGFVMRRHTPSSNSRAYAILGGAPETEITFRLPGLRWEHVVIGRRHVLSFSAMTPISATETRMNQIVWSDHPVFALLKPLIRLAGRAFLRQDGRIMQAQAPGVADNPAMLWMGEADQQARWYAQLKREWFAAGRDRRPFRNPVSARVLRWIS